MQSGDYGSWSALALLTLVAAIAGCGNSYELETARVSGRITIDGEPLTAGYVLVLPSKGRTARGTIQPDGTFVLGTYAKDDGAQVGLHSVAVTPVPADEEGGKRQQGPKIPKRYRSAASSHLTLKVEPDGVEDWVIELSSAR